MSKYTVLIFDADETLFDYRRGEAYALEKSLEGAGVKFESSHIDLYGEINKGLWQAYERGEVDRDALRHERFVRFLAAIKEDAMDAVLLSESYLGYLGDAGFMISGAMELLEELSGRFRLALLTNGFSSVQRSRIKKTNTGRFFDAIVISEETGYQKPQPEIYTLLLDNLEHENRRDVLMIGDSMTSDIEGAARAGLDTCWYNPDRLKTNGKATPTYEIHNLKELYSVL